MSNESLESAAASVAGKTSPIPDQRGRTPVPDILRHQKSFEQRYSHIIHKQILETSINKEVLQRQMNAFFPFSRSSSLQCDAGGDNRKQKKVEADLPESDVDMAESGNTDKLMKNTQRSLQKLETLDIADKEANIKHK